MPTTIATLVTREIEIKTTMRYDFEPAQMPKRKIPDHTECWQGGGAKEMEHDGEQWKFPKK